MSATMNFGDQPSDDQDPNRFGEEFADLFSEPVTPQDVLAVYQAIYKKNQQRAVLDGMVSVEDLTADQVRMAFQICEEVNKVDDRLGLEITKDEDDQRLSVTTAAVYRAVMLMIALRGTHVSEKTNFWKVGAIVMTTLVIALSTYVLTVH
jgi:hypothetical protein